MPPLSDSSAEALLNATRRFTRVSINQSHAMLSGDMSRADWHLMWLLRSWPEASGARPSELARRLRVTAGNVAQQLRSLESKKLIVRTQDNEDRRAVMIKLTALGKTKLEAIRSEYVIEFERLTTHLGVKDTALLIRLLTTAAEHLEKTEGSSC